MAKRAAPDAHDIAAEIIRRTTSPDGTKRYVIRLSRRPTLGERLQLLAARLERRPIAIVPHKYESAQVWIEQYARSTDP
jgi:hypothetical protein